jgi:hypothetical protein
MFHPKFSLPQVVAAGHERRRMSAHPKIDASAVKPPQCPHSRVLAGRSNYPVADSHFDEAFVAMTLDTYGHATRR